MVSVGSMGSDGIPFGGRDKRTRYPAERHVRPTYRGCAPLVLTAETAPSGTNTYSGTLPLCPMRALSEKRGRALQIFLREKSYE